MAEVTFVIEGEGKKENDNSLTGIRFTHITIDGNKSEKIIDEEPGHAIAKKVLSELLSQNTVKGNASVVPSGETTDGSSVGTTDGSSVGTTDGSSVGTTDGSLVGTTDGSSVGTTDGSSVVPTEQENKGGSSHRRKSYKKEKKIKGGKRKSLRRNKHV